MIDSKICLALDGQSVASATNLAWNLGKSSHALKIHDLLDKFGPVVMGSLKRNGARLVWVDYKLHDTKDTVGLRVAALVKNGADIITVHASGGIPMMEAAVAAAQDKCQIWAITLLTSHTWRNRYEEPVISPPLGLAEVIMSSLYVKSES